MKMTVEVDCTPEEARRFLGLPDVTALNEQMVEEMKKRIGANMAMVAPEELMKTWMSFGAGATEQFRKLMDVGLSAAAKKCSIRSSRRPRRPDARRWRWSGFPGRRRRGCSGASPGDCRRPAAPSFDAFGTFRATR